MFVYLHREQQICNVFITFICKYTQIKYNSNGTERKNKAKTRVLEQAGG